MIDLRFNDLPSHIECGGFLFELNTDFRVWIEFERVLREDNQAWYGVFKDEIPQGNDWVEAALEFLQSKNETPRETGGGNGERTIDYILDGDYIVAAFQQAYGIDLTSCEYMHWHRFKALIQGLPKETKLSEIMSYRAWEKSTKKPDEMARYLQSVWRLPNPKEKEEVDELLKLADEFFS